MKIHTSKRRSALLRATLGSCLVGLNMHGMAQRLSVTNPLDVPRSEEIVDLPLSDVVRHIHAAPEQIVVVDDATRQRIPTQTYSTLNADAPPDRFLVLVKVPAHATLHLTFQHEGHTPPSFRLSSAVKHRSARTTLPGKTSWWLIGSTAPPCKRPERSPRASTSGALGHIGKVIA